MTALEKELNIDDYRCWTDSMVALAWIKAFDKEFKTFCQNRVVEIRKKTDVNKWGYCKSVENPADLITRFNNFEVLTQKMWWNGPKFIHSMKEDENSYQQRKGDALYLQTNEFHSEVKSNKEPTTTMVHATTARKTTGDGTNLIYGNAQSEYEESGVVCGSLQALK